MNIKRCSKCGRVKDVNIVLLYELFGLRYNCPFYCSECHSLNFQWNAVRDISFVWPIPPTKTYIKGGNIERPDDVGDVEDEIFGRNSYGVLLSTGPGYWAKKSKCCDSFVLPKFVPTCKNCNRPCFSKYVFHPTQYVSKGKVVFYDKYVPWRFYPKTPEGKEEMVVICGFGDIKGVVDDYDGN